MPWGQDQPSVAVPAEGGWGKDRITVRRRGGSAAGARPTGPTPRPRPAAPPKPNAEPSGRLPRLTAQGTQDTLATGIGLITNPYAAGAMVMRGIAGGADWIGQHIDDPTDISGRTASFLNKQADSYGPTAADRARRLFFNEAAPTNATERLAYGAGAALPGLALGPGAVIPTALSAGGGYAAGEATRLIPGSSDQDAEMASTVGSIVAPGLAVGIPRLRGAVTPQPIDLPAATAQALEALPQGARDLPPPAMAQLQADLRAGMRPEDAAVRAVNSTLAEPIPMSRGQTSGLPDQQAMENAMRAGAMGRTPAEIARAQSAQAQAAITTNLNQIGEGVVGGPVPARGAGGALASERLNGMYDAQRAQTDRAYAFARDSSGDSPVAVDLNTVAGKEPIDQALNILRRGRGVSEGQSLLQWLSRRGGLRDEGGELSALDAQLWHKDKPYWGRLVRDDGARLDDAAQSAQEAGFLPERFSRDGVVDTRATPADLLEAVRRELAGEPIRSQFNVKNQELASYARDLDEAVGLAGIDLSRMNNTEARAALDAYFAGRENQPTPPNDVPAEALDLRSRLNGVMREYDPLNPDVASVVREVQTLAGGKPSARLLYDARARLSRLRGNDTEVGAARRVIGELDSYISDALDAGAFDGEPGAVMAWRDALNERRTQGRTFEGNDLIEGLTQRNFRSGERTTEVAPEDAGIRIFGTGNSWVNKPNLSRDLTRMREILGPESPEWAAVRGENFRRLMDAGRGPLEAGTDTFSGRNFANAWRDARRNAMPTLRELYSPGEIAALDRLAFLADRTTSPVTGGKNYSNSATTAKILTTGKIGSVLRVIPGAEALIDLVRNTQRTGEARRAFIDPQPNRGGAPRVPRRPMAPLTRQDALALTGPGLIGAGNRQGE